MKRICFFILVIAAGFISCGKNDDYQYHYEDIMYFIEDYTSDGTVLISPITQLDVKSNSSMTLFVTRNNAAANHHPKQTAQIVVDEEKSTAIAGTDFTISEQTFNFIGKNNVNLPFVINTRAATGKVIVLQLNYAYYDECPADGRKVDRLKIKIK